MIRPLKSGYKKFVMLVGPEEFDETRLRNSLNALRESLKVSVDEIITRVVPGLVDKMSSYELTTLISETSASMATRHPDYSTFAARVAAAQLYRITPSLFSDAMEILEKEGILAPEVSALAKKVEHRIDHSRDRDLTYFGFKTLETSYLLRVHQKVVERPQYLFMRVALSIHMTDLERVFETYDFISNKYFIHATPTLTNAGTLKPQYSSCFLTGIQSDTIEGVFETLKECATISKHSGGIGLHASNITAEHSHTKLDGVAGGIVPMLRVFNNMARYVVQGSNKRPGAISVTLEPWHADILAFLDLRKNYGNEENRARDLFYALWVPDLFMRAVQENQTWYLFSPDMAPGLSEVYGKDFETLYHSYVEQGLYSRSYPAQKLWAAIISAQIETGNPSILYKDACNSKSNQKNLGTIKSSNLCTEIVEFSSPEETAVCNLASIALPQFVKEGKFDLKLLHKVTKVIATNLDKVIDITLYPLESAKRSNLRNRPMGIGVQGLADVYMALGYPFESQEAMELNKQVFETIYHGALERSMELARDLGRYESYGGSPAAQGLLQFDLWGCKPENSLWDWSELKKGIAMHGLRNSLVTALMPTASTSQIFGYTECFEPLTSNIYARRVMSGEFQVVNRYLVAELESLGLWNDTIRQRIIADNGSVQGIEEIPATKREVFKTVWEIKQRNLIDQSAARGPYIDQSQSLNIFLANPTQAKMTAMHLYGWSKGLKTGIYYLRSQAASMPTPFTVEHGLVNAAKRCMSPYLGEGEPMQNEKGDSMEGVKRAKNETESNAPCDMCSA